MYPLVHLCIYLCILSVSIYYIHEKTHEKNNYINCSFHVIIFQVIIFFPCASGNLVPTPALQVGQESP